MGVKSKPTPHMDACLSARRAERAVEEVRWLEAKRHNATNELQATLVRLRTKEASKSDYASEELREVQGSLKAANAKVKDLENHIIEITSAQDLLRSQLNKYSLTPSRPKPVVDVLTTEQEFKLCVTLDVLRGQLSVFRTAADCLEDQVRTLSLNNSQLGRKRTALDSRVRALQVQVAASRVPLAKQDSNRETNVLSPTLQQFKSYLGQLAAREVKSDPSLKRLPRWTPEKRVTMEETIVESFSDCLSLQDLTLLEYIAIRKCSRVACDVLPSARAAGFKWRANVHINLHWWVVQRLDELVEEILWEQDEAGRSPALNSATDSIASNASSTYSDAVALYNKVQRLAAETESLRVKNATLLLQMIPLA